jgi:hypothetical protein
MLTLDSFRGQSEPVTMVTGWWPFGETAVDLRNLFESCSRVQTQWVPPKRNERLRTVASETDL